MPVRDGDEPVFTRSRLGTNHVVFNPRNPVGRVLIVVTLAAIAVVLILMYRHAGPFARPTPEPAPHSTAPDVSRWLPSADPPPSP